jgi:hypothetical protein
VSGEEELARLAAGDQPIETGGATAVFEAIARGRLTADVMTYPAGHLGAEHAGLLQVVSPADLHVRAGVLLCAAGVPVSQVTTLVVTSRVPERARASLGITRAGTLAPVPGGTPLGRALRGLGVRREQQSVVLTPECRDAFGSEQALRSCALLRSADGLPLAWVTERVYARFLEAFPPPWPDVPAVRTPA